VLGHITFSWFWLLLLGVAFTVTVVLLLRALFPDFARESRGSSGDTALELLRERFARGELDETEYERRRAVLQGTPRQHLRTRA